MNTPIAPRHATPPANRRQRRAAARKKKVNPLPLCIAAAAIFAGVAFGDFDSAETTPPASSVVPSEARLPDTSGEVTPVCALYINPLLTGLVDLDLTAQNRIYEMCHRNDRLFCSVMAIASVETHFDPEAIGDGGKSLGLMQINIRWQADRIEALGITDLTDYQQNVAVALDYIAWIAERLAPDDPESTYGTSPLFMAYNSGYSGAMKLLESGIEDTDYSAECLSYYMDYMELLEVSAHG